MGSSGPIATSRLTVLWRVFTLRIVEWRVDWCEQSPAQHSASAVSTVGKLGPDDHLRQTGRRITIPAQREAIVEILVNGEPIHVATGTTVSTLLAQLQMNPLYVAVERNLDLIPRAQHADCALQPQDRVEIVTLVGGG
jgi:sulfur carrier protein